MAVDPLLGVVSVFDSPLVLVNLRLQLFEAVPGDRPSGAALPAGVRVLPVGRERRLRADLQASSGGLPSKESVPAASLRGGVR